MDILKEGQEQAAISLTPVETDMTLEDFLESDLAGYEYAKGELIPMPPTSGKHGEISSNIHWHLYSHVRTNQLGRVYIADTGFQIGERVLMPDIAFISTARLPDDRQKAFSIPPDLAVEVVSRTDILHRVEEKAFAYLEAGTRMVWVFKPVSETVMVYRAKTDIKVLTCKDTLTGEEVVEGFSCQVAQLFE